jgi:hypothetical protein
MVGGKCGWSSFIFVYTYVLVMHVTYYSYICPSSSCILGVWDMIIRRIHSALDDTGSLSYLLSSGTSFPILPLPVEINLELH